MPTRNENVIKSGLRDLLLNYSDYTIICQPGIFYTVIVLVELLEKSNCRFLFIFNN
jgi:hypothetical protein